MINLFEMISIIYTKINKNICYFIAKKILKIIKYIFKFHFYFSIYSILFKKQKRENKD